MGEPGHLCPRCGMRGGHANSCPRDGSQQLRARVQTLEEERDSAHASLASLLQRSVQSDARIQTLEKVALTPREAALLLSPEDTDPLEQSSAWDVVRGIALIEYAVCPDGTWVKRRALAGKGDKDEL